MSQHLMYFLPSIAVGALALLSMRKRLGWPSVIALMIVWGVAADGRGEGLMRAYYRMVERLDGASLFDAWGHFDPYLGLSLTNDVLVLVILGVVGLSLLTLHWLDFRRSD